MSDIQTKAGSPTEFNLIDFFWSVMRHWRSILSVALVIGILFGGYSAIKGYISYTDKDAIAARKASYEASMEIYEADKSRLEKQIENLKSSLERQQKMQEEAVILQIDPYNVHTCTLSYYVDTNYRIAPGQYYQNPDYTSSIVSGYLAVVTRLDLDSILSNGTGTHLTSANPLSDSKKSLLTTSSDNANGLFTVTVYGDTQKTVDLITEAVKGSINEMTPVITLAVGRHSLTLVSESVKTITDPDIVEIKNKFNTNFENDSAALQEANLALTNLEKPKSPVISKRGILTEAIKFFLIGVVLGIVLFIIVALIAYILRDRLHSANEIRARYRKAVLGTVSGGKKRRFDRFVLRMLGVSDQADEDAYAFIAANIKLRLTQAKEILLIGSVGEDKLNEIKDGLAPLLGEGFTVTTGGNINTNADAVESLHGDRAVICVEKITSTAHENIRRETESLNIAKKELLGFVICG